MKRSEMIQVMKNVTDKHTGYLVNDLKVINELLDAIEKAGMLPPKSLDTVCVKKGLVRGYTQMFDWEPED